MKVYKLTIGIDELAEEVEFISEELYNVDDKPETAEETEEATAEETFLIFLRRFLMNKYTIVGRA